MIVYTMTAQTKAAIVAALAAHGADRLAVAGLGRVLRGDSALTTAAFLSAWPVDPDGKYRVALNVAAGMIAWRAYILEEIALGRGRRDNIAAYCQALGIETRQAFHYVMAVLKGSGMRACAFGCWSENTKFVACSGNVPEPRKQWARSAWAGRARAHAALAEVGLALPNRPIWRPLATCLFDEPVLVKPARFLAPADEEALTRLAG